ncbi:MAG TPA: Crp/Fnr family transcriptional regulator [Chloroflexota bacterium]|jgi:CRP-like cAMP-binding protein|nr:Crp/Fnr family transcriptional regulator [Chloroflexota bacterium]
MSNQAGRHDPRVNHVLAALPPKVLERLTPQLTHRRVDHGEILLYADEAVDQVYFPTSGVFSLVVKGENGSAVEAAVVGREGLLGSAAVLGSGQSTFEELCQVDPGTALALPAAVLRAEMESEPLVRLFLLRYVAALLTATARSVACNRLHRAEQRLARWLLEVRDRVEGDTFYLTQEFLGQMLGVRRPTVTEAAATLERAGLLRHERGRIRLLDEPGLEAVACEDYRCIRDAYALLAG